MYPILNKLIRCEKVQPLYTEFLLDYEGKRYPIRVNKTAASILELCNGKNSIDEMVGVLANKYGDTLEKTKGFVEDFLVQAEKAKHIDMLYEKYDRIREIKCIGSEEYWTPEIVAFELTHRCPLKCKHCYLNAGKGNDIDTGLVLDMLDECVELGVDNIQYTGGEPLLHPDFFKLLNEALDRKLYVNLFTSGYVIDKTIIEKFNHYKGNSNLLIQVSIDGMMEKHNTFRGREEAFERSISFIREMLQIGIRVDVGTCVYDQTYEELRELSLYLKDVGVRLHRISPISNRGRAKENLRGSVNEDIANLKENIKKLSYELSDNNFSVFYFEEGNFNINYKYKRNCGLGQTSIKIDPEGKVYPCLMADIEYANLFKMTLKEVQKKYSRIWEKLGAPINDECRKCTNKEICNGCVNEAIMYCNNGESQFEREKKCVLSELKD